MNETRSRRAWCVSRLVVLGLCLADGLAWGGETAAGEGQAARIAALCKELGQGQFGSQSACEQLIAIGAPAVPALLEALNDRRPPARWWAVAALCNIAADDAYPAVLKVLESDPDPLVRSTAVYYLRHYRNKGKKDIWPVVAKALGDKDPEVGRWALRLMVEDGYPELDKVLRDVLAGGPTELRSYALSHIRDLGDKGKAYMPLVRKLLAAEDPRLRYDVVFTVVSLMDSGQMEFLRETFRKDPDPAVKECALRCITVVPEPPVDCFELYVEGMRSEDEKVRDVAFKLLVKGFKHYIGFDAKGPLPMREAAIAKWREWFAQNRAKLEWHPDLRKFLLQGTRPKPSEKAKGGSKGRADD
mgnify:CR=1 FL=1